MKVEYAGYTGGSWMGHMRSWALSCVTNWKRLTWVVYFVVNLSRGTVLGIQCTTSYDKKTSHTCSLNSFCELACGLMGVMSTGVWWKKCKKSNLLWKRSRIYPGPCIGIERTSVCRQCLFVYLHQNEKGRNPRVQNFILQLWWVRNPIKLF